MSFAPSPELRAIRRRTLFVTAAAVPLFAVIDAVIVGGVAPGPLAIRLVWAAAVALCGWPLLRASDRTYHALLLLGAAISPPFYAALCAQLGGANGPLFAWALALPVGIAALIEEELAAVVAACITSVASAAVLLFVARADPSTFSIWMLLYAASVFIAVRASLSYRNYRRVELEQKRRLEESERRRERSERLALIGQLASGVAHEVKNPLSIALLQLDFLSRESSAKDRVESVQRALDRVAQILGDLKDFSRALPADAQLEAVTAEDVIRETLRLADVRLKGLARVETNMGSPLPKVRAQPRQLSQVLLNLLINAADAIESERQKDDAFIRIAAKAHDGKVRISVEDNGPGIPEHVRERLFEPFFTTKADKGTGLGLALSREYVERFGGNIAAEERPGGGARFVIDLVAAEAPRT